MKPKSTYQVEIEGNDIDISPAIEDFLEKGLGKHLQGRISAELMQVEAEELSAEELETGEVELSE